jgi:hypothetical protein
MNPIARPTCLPAHGLWALTLALICLTGCQTDKGPSADSTASILVHGRTTEQILQTAIPVFQRDGWNLQTSSEFEAVLDRPGTKTDTRRYGSIDGKPVRMRAALKVEVYGDAMVLRCDASAVRNPDDKFFADSQKVSSLSAGYYRGMMKTVQARLAAPPSQ